MNVYEKVYMSQFHLVLRALKWETQYTWKHSTQGNTFDNTNKINGDWGKLTDKMSPLKLVKMKLKNAC